jgi:hypothetical protein
LARYGSNSPHAGFGVTPIVFIDRDCEEWYRSVDRYGVFGHVTGEARGGAIMINPIGEEPDEQRLSDTGYARLVGK